MTPHPQLTKDMQDILDFLILPSEFELSQTIAMEALDRIVDGHSSQQSERDISTLKKAIIEVLDTGFESSERDLVLVIDRIDAWEKGELCSSQQVERDNVLDGFLHWVKPECVKELVRTYKQELRTKGGEQR